VTVFAVIKEHQDGTVTVPVVSDSYGGACRRAEQLRDAEYNELDKSDAFSWERKSEPSAAHWWIESVGDERVEWYVTQVDEVVE
jgi:hypothetical protein